MQCFYGFIVKGDVHTIHILKINPKIHKRLHIGLEFLALLTQAPLRDNTIAVILHIQRTAMRNHRQGGFNHKSSVFRTLSLWAVF